MPFVPDSRGGISDHRKKVMEIMSRGGGVGSNGSTLRPRHTIVKGVNGRSSGSVSWMDDIAKLTHLVEQGGSRRGAQMIMLADWHPDIFEFIIRRCRTRASCATSSKISRMSRSACWRRKSCISRRFLFKRHQHVHRHRQLQAHPRSRRF